MTDIQSIINPIIDELIPVERFKSAMVLTKLIKNTYGVKCPTCKSENVHAMSKQTRSADETETKFFTCLDCGAKWRQN